MHARAAREMIAHSPPLHCIMRWFVYLCCSTPCDVGSLLCHRMCIVCALWCAQYVCIISASIPGMFFVSPHRFSHASFVVPSVFVCVSLGHLRCVACERCFSVICSRIFARGMCVTCCTVVASWYCSVGLCPLVLYVSASPRSMCASPSASLGCAHCYIYCVVWCPACVSAPLRIISASCPHHLAVLFCHMCLPLWFASAPHQVRTF